MRRGEYVLSSRIATLEKIKRRGELIRDKYTKIDECLLVDGWTEKNFNPPGLLAERRIIGVASLGIAITGRASFRRQ